MSRQLFFDSSAIFAWADTSSPEGGQIERYIRKERAALVTTNLVMAETLSLVTKRIGKHEGIRLGERLQASRIIRIACVDEKLFQTGWQLYKKYKDKDFDLIDAVSFAICHRDRIHTCITLDRHYTQMGFTVFPD